MKKYILVDPNDDSGNDDGILDSMEMSSENAKKINQRNREEGSDLRWIEVKPRKMYGTIPYPPEYYE